MDARKPAAAPLYRRFANLKPTREGTGSIAGPMRWQSQIGGGHPA
jgi:hypothetical protein